MEKNPSGHRENLPAGGSTGKPERLRRDDPDREFWQQFASARTVKEFCQSWLPLQCRMLEGVRCAMVLMGTADRGPYTPVAVWPDAKLSMNHLTGAAERALRERRGLLVENPPDENGKRPFPEAFHVAYPIEVSGKLHGVVVLGVDHPDRSQVQGIMRKLHWGAAWIEVLIRRREAEAAEELNQRLQKVLALLSSAAEQDRFQASAMNLVTQLATEIECERVALGLLIGARVRLQVISHSADFGKQMNLVRAIETAMDEAVDQSSVVHYPPAENAPPLVTRAHEELNRKHGAGAVCTFPLESGGRSIGALMLERPPERPFSEETIALIESVASLTGPLLDARRAEERWIGRKVYDSAVDQLKKLFGPRHPVRKALAVLLVGFGVFISLYHVDYRVTAPTALEGSVQRVVAAPFSGYILEAPVRPGDIVDEGEVLCRLDDRDLVLERLRWLTEREQFSKEYQAALARHDRSKIRVLRAKIQQADAQLTLIEEQLARTRIAAPFDGIVMSGDLSQSLGAPVERGEVLFEVAPLDSYRVIAEVDERDIGQIREGQQSDLVLSSMPGDVFSFTVERITPVSVAQEGRNYFRVEGKMDEPSDRLRPGMEGIGKINAGRHRLIWVWTHEAIDWLRLQFWRWRP